MIDFWCDYLSDKPFEELWSIFSGHYIEHCADRLLPYPGVEETLQELKRRGIALGINTNKPDFAVKAISEKFPWMKEFFGDAIIAGGNCAEMKPSALPLRECAIKLGRQLSPADVMVGDSWNDVHCAANAGVRSAFCTFWFGELKDVPPTYSIDTFSDLLQIPMVESNGEKIPMKVEL